MSRIVSWTEYFMEIAAVVARKSKDPNTQVGCVLVGPDNETLATGYNGLPPGVSDLPERMERPAKYLWTAHAEENAVARAARVGARLKGATAYVTHAPCARCARSLIAAGVAEVVIGDGTTAMPEEEFQVAGTMFREAGITVHYLGGGA